MGVLILPQNSRNAIHRLLEWRYRVLPTYLCPFTYLSVFYLFDHKLCQTYVDHVDPTHYHIKSTTWNSFYLYVLRSLVYLDPIREELTKSVSHFEFLKSIPWSFFLGKNRAATNLTLRISSFPDERYANSSGKIKFIF